jgi:hypothetical protein
MLATIYLSPSETATYCGASRASLIAYARNRAWRHGRRFVQLVGADGHILDIVEVDLTTRRG